jgi:glycosyltransferase involved in cell wall biosynthesis
MDLRNCPPPKITLITIVRNGAAFIENCLLSVINQGYQNLEYIVLDGASTDGTQSIIEKYRHNISIYYSRPDEGAYDATLQALAMATGDIIGFVMADDWLNDGALSEIAGLYRQKPDSDIFCFGMQEFRLMPNGNRTSQRIYCDPFSSNFMLLDGMYCQGINRFYSSRIIKEEGYFRQDLYPNLADRDLYMRLGLRGLNKAWTNKILYNFLVHSGSNSTGGNAEKFTRFLDETVKIATDYLKSDKITPTQISQLKDWYCFNTLRSIWYTLKAKRPLEALTKLISVLSKYPVRTIKNILFWRMPKGYKHLTSE